MNDPGNLGGGAHLHRCQPLPVPPCKIFLPSAPPSLIHRFEIRLVLSSVALLCENSLQLKPVVSGPIIPLDAGRRTRSDCFRRIGRDGRNAFPEQEF